MVWGLSLCMCNTASFEIAECLGIRVLGLKVRAEGRVER